MTKRLALGTVQFGMSYGIANRSGQSPFAEAKAIILTAAQHGIDTLDTAIAYGESESRLGEIGVLQWRVISKLPGIPLPCADVDAWVQQGVRGSLGRLRIPRLGGLLLHRASDLLGPHGDELYSGLLAARDQGKVEKVGVSIYDPEELEAICARFKLDLVQAPFNVVDRRLVSSGWLSRLADAQVEIHVRSIFLQGLLLMEPQNRPAQFSRWQAMWRAWDLWLEEGGVTPLQACLGFVLARPEISRVVIGVESEQQLKDIVSSLGARSLEAPEALCNSDPRLINPSNWTPS